MEIVLKIKKNPKGKEFFNLQKNLKEKQFLNLQKNLKRKVLYFKKNMKETVYNSNKRNYSQLKKDLKGKCSQYSTT